MSTQENLPLPQNIVSPKTKLPGDTSDVSDSSFPFIDAVEFLKQHSHQGPEKFYEPQNQVSPEDNLLQKKQNKGKELRSPGIEDAVVKTTQKNTRINLVQNEDDAQSRTQQQRIARKIIIRQLSASQKTRYQIEQKLRAESIEETIIAEELNQFAFEGYINDHYFADEWVRQRSKTRSLGNAILQEELRKKGIAEDYIPVALEQREVSEYDAAQEIVSKKLKTVVFPLNYAEQQKYKRRLNDMLIRKGIPSSIALKVISDTLHSLNESS